MERENRLAPQLKTPDYVCHAILVVHLQSRQTSLQNGEANLFNDARLSRYLEGVCSGASEAMFG